jgi:hypothetical protein
MVGPGIADRVLVVDMDRAWSSTLAELLKREGWSAWHLNRRCGCAASAQGAVVDPVAMGSDGSREIREALIKQMRAAFPDIANRMLGSPHSIGSQSRGCG